MQKVEDYYDSEVEREWQRQERHRTEFAVTLRAMGEFLPPPPAQVLDIGGGPGRYSIELSCRGYAVTLLDLSQKNLDFAAARAQEAGVVLAGAVHGNALNLEQFGDQSFDAVLLMGPLYHLTAEEERRQSIGEARRVLRPGGVLLAAFITRYAPFRDAAARWPEQLGEQPSGMDKIVEDGINIGPGFTDAYFALPQEVIPLMEGFGFATRALLGVEGIVGGHEEKINQLGGVLWERWLTLNYYFAHDPALWAAADHLLYIGRK